MEIYLNDIKGNSIKLEANDINKYFGSDYPKKDSTLIILNDETEIRVSDDFETVDYLVLKNKTDQNEFSR